MSACGLMQWATGEYLLAPFATRVSLELLAFAVAERKRCPERAAERVRRPYALRSRWARIEARILPLAVVVPWLALVMSESLKMGPALRGRCRPGQSAEAPGCEPRISVCGSHWCEAICWPVLQAVFILLAGTARTDRSFESAIYQSVFQTKKGEWEEHRLPMKDFVPTFRGRVLSSEPPLDPARVTSVGFLIADKQDGPFQLAVAWIKVALPAGQ